GVTRFAGCATVGDILARQYGEAAGVAGGLCAFLCCAGVVGAQVETMGMVCRQLFGLPETAGVLIGCGVVMLYAAGGGVQAVIRADLVQF
ncbi:sodium:solute symporter family transporter, partial [Klebsiella pneumoniae]|uniref:sodium:solute symporter family transporter n=1 Tax=Klebsiella pneumoniae TaxID=573 RepID=UPI0025A2BCB2